VSGTADVVTEIAEADRDGGILRYRGIDLRELVGHVPFEQVWGLLVDEALHPGLPPAEPFPLPVRTGDVRVDVQSALAQLAPVWGFHPLLDIDATQAREDLARSVFGWKIDESTLAVVLAAVALSWSTPRDLREGLVTLGREALLLSAREQGQLGTVEDELFRLGRIVAGDAEFEQALSDRTTTTESKRTLLGQVLYGKVTAVTEALAGQAIARPDAMAADDLDALSRQAAELQGQSVAVVTSATELTTEQRAALEGKLAEIYGREMAVHVQVDQAVLGGMVIRVGDEIIDGSVAGRLSAVRRALP